VGCIWRHHSQPLSIVTVHTEGTEYGVGVQWTVVRTTEYTEQLISSAASRSPIMAIFFRPASGFRARRSAEEWSTRARQGERGGAGGPPATFCVVISAEIARHYAGQASCAIGRLPKITAPWQKLVRIRGQPAAGNPGQPGLASSIWRQLGERHPAAANRPPNLAPRSCSSSHGRVLVHRPCSAS